MLKNTTWNETLHIFPSHYLSENWTIKCFHTGRKDSSAREMGSSNEHVNEQLFNSESEVHWFEIMHKQGLNYSSNAPISCFYREQLKCTQASKNILQKTQHIRQVKRGYKEGAAWLRSSISSPCSTDLHFRKMIWSTDYLIYVQQLKRR